MLTVCQKDQRGVYVDAHMADRVFKNGDMASVWYGKVGETRTLGPGSYDVFADGGFHIMSIEVAKDRAIEFISPRHALIEARTVR